MGENFLSRKSSFDNMSGMGWKNLQSSLEKLRINFTNLCDALSTIVTLEHHKVFNAGNFAVEETSRIILVEETKFIEKFREQVKCYKREEIEGGDHVPEYVTLYKTLVNGINNSIAELLVGLNEQLALKTQAHSMVLQENKKLNAKIVEKDKECTEMTSKRNTLVTEKNTINARSNKLEQQLQQKNCEIAQLRREGTVALWKNEKKKIVTDMMSREHELEIKLDNITENSDDAKNRLLVKIKQLQDQVNVLKVQRDSRTGISNQEAVNLKRLLYVKERLLIVAESELQKQQTYYHGLLTGLNKDLRVLMSRQTEQSEEYKFEQHVLTDRIGKILNAVQEGTMTKVRSTLPSQYLGIDVQIKGSPIKSTVMNKSTLYVDSDNAHKYYDLDKVDVNSNMFKWRTGPDIISPKLGDILKDIKKGHPKLIRSNGVLQVKEAMTYFPYYSERNIRRFHSYFTKLDSNGDYSLDTPEILRFLPGMLDCLATTDEVADAIREVDLDESGNIDFFEFLLLNRLLEKGEGKAKLFNKEEVREIIQHQESLDEPDCNKKEQLDQSKVCSIQ